MAALGPKGFLLGLWLGQDGWSACTLCVLSFVSKNLIWKVYMRKSKAMNGERWQAYCRWGTGTALRVLDVGARPPGELLEEEGALETHLFDLTLHAVEAQVGGVVGVLNFFGAVLELDAFSAVGFFHGRWERRWDAS